MFYWLKHIFGDIETSLVQDKKLSWLKVACVYIENKHFIR